MTVTSKLPMKVFIFLPASIVTGVVFAEAILFLRLYALAGRNKRFMIGLAVQFIVSAPSNLSQRAESLIPLSLS